MSRKTLLLSLFMTAMGFMPGAMADALLTYKIDGVSSALEKNVAAWLGREPDSVEERSNFIAAAEQRAGSGLKALGYYRPDIDIQLQKKTTPWKMRIKITPNEPVRISTIDLAISGEAATDPEFKRLMSDLPFSEGDVFNHGVYEGFKKRVLSTGQQRGYFDARTPLSRVEVNVEDGSAILRLHYESGQRYRFGEISFDESFMEMEWVDAFIGFHSGDLFEQALLQRLRAELQQTRYFSTVTVRARLDALDKGTVPIEVMVTPTYRHGFDFGVGFSTDTEERISVTWRTPLLNRYGHSQETRVEFSTFSPSGRFTYNIPLTHPLNDVLQLSAYLEEREYGDLDSRQKGVRVRREIKRGKFINSYSARTLDESWAVGNEHKDNSYVLPGLSVSHKSRSGPLVDPESGFHQVYLIEAGHQDIGSDANLARFYSNYRLVIPIAQDHRLVSRAEMGALFAAESDLPELAPSLRFFTGGSQSIRGFSYQSIGTEVAIPQRDGSVREGVVVGGNRLLTASIEYQYYVNQNWRGATFIDFGDAFDDSDFDAHYGAGFGLHYLSPVGAIRLELARDISERDPSWTLHFNIGAEF
jgi:translocation and assembly module TamA